MPGRSPWYVVVDCVPMAFPVGATLEDVRASARTLADMERRPVEIRYGSYPGGRVQETIPAPGCPGI